MEGTKTEIKVAQGRKRRYGAYKWLLLHLDKRQTRDDFFGI